MSPEFEQLVEYNVQDVVKIIVEERGCTVAEAMDEFYSSRVYEGLVDAETGLYLQSPAYLYELHCQLSNSRNR